MRKAIFASQMALIILLFFFAQSASAFVPEYKFIDSPLDSSSNLYDLGSRHYSPEIGKFVQPDPMFIDTELYANSPDKKTTQKNQELLNKLLTNPQQLNNYSYSVNNPIIYLDPSGRLQVHFDKDMTEEQKQDFFEGLDYLINTVKDNQQVIDYFNKFDVDIVEVLSDNNKGPDVYFKDKEVLGLYNPLFNDITISFKAITEGLQTIASTLIHELGHWANDVAKRWGNLNPEVTEYGFNSYIKDFVETYFYNGEKYYKKDGIYGFLAEMLTFGYIF